MRTAFRQTVGIALVGLLIACADGGDTLTVAQLDAPATQKLAELRATRLQRPTPTPQQVHEQNAMDAVGVAHNIAIKKYRAILMRGGSLSGQCEKIRDILVSSEGQRPGAVVNGAAAAAFANDAIAKCKARAETLRGVRGVRRGYRPVNFPANEKPAQGANFVPVVNNTSADFTLSNDAATLLSAIDAAVAGSSSPGDLAGELSLILSASSSLTIAVEDTIVMSVASVAQSSFEDNYENLGPSLLAAYDETYPCEEPPPQLRGSSMMAENEGCEEDPPLLRNTLRSSGSRSSLFRHVSFTRLPRPHSECAGVANVKAVARNDVYGAVAGGVLAAAGTMGVGVIPGAFAGAAAASAGEIAGQYWDYFSCRLQ